MIIFILFTVNTSPTAFGARIGRVSRSRPREASSCQKAHGLNGVCYWYQVIKAR